MFLARRTQNVLKFTLLLLTGLVTLTWWQGWFALWPQELARQALVRRDYEAARRWTQQAIRFDDRNAETEFLLARLERKRGQLAEVRRHLVRAAALGCDRDRLHREELLAQAQTGALDRILSDLDRMLIDHSDDGAEICEAYANGLLINGQLDEAQSVIQQWQIAFPSDPQTENLLARLAEFHHRPTEAEAHYRKALAKNPQHFSSAYGLGRILAELNRWQEAYDSYQDCLALPVKAPAQVGMARCLVGLGKDEPALELLHAAATCPRDKLIEAFHQLGEPTESDLLSFELGSLEAHLGNTEEAIRWLQQAVNYNPKHREARYLLAYTLNAAGQSEAAKIHFEWHSRIQSQLVEIDQLHDLVKTDPENLEVRFRLGTLSFETDSESAGLFWIRSVLARDPNHQAAQDKLQEFRQRKQAE